MYFSPNGKENHIIEPHRCTMWLEKIHLVETFRLSLSWRLLRIGRQYGMQKRKIVEVMECLWFTSEQLQKIIKGMLGPFTVAELYKGSHVYFWEASFPKTTRQCYCYKGRKLTDRNCIHSCYPHLLPLPTLLTPFLGRKYLVARGLIYLAWEPAQGEIVFLRLSFARCTYESIWSGFSLLIL